MKSFRQTVRSPRLILKVMLSVALILAIGSVADGQDEAVVRGKIVFDESQGESWDGNQLVVPFEDIAASLRERIVFLPPYPKEFNTWNLEQKLDWEKEFLETEAGKKFQQERKARFAAARVFEIKFEKGGEFVVYDVPAGVYGIQGRVDREIGGTKFGFEVFGQIEVLKDVDELVLKPMRVEITPMFSTNQKAPPIAVKTHDDKSTLSLSNFKDHKYLFVNFWTSASPSAAREQKLIQEMYQALAEKFDLKLLSVNVDVDRKKAMDFIIGNQLKSGSHGFTDGLENRTLFDYGVRSLPSFWLIGADGKILMTQYEVAQAMRVKPSITVIVSDRIEGKDTPSPATPAK